MINKSISKKDLIIFGTSGFALELSHLMKDHYNILGFIGSKPLIKLPFKYIGNDNKILKIPNNVYSIVAIGDILVREKIYLKLVKHRKKITSFIHPKCYFDLDIKAPKGLICYPNSTIHAGVKLVFGTLINSNVTIGHETIISKFVNINPGVSMGGRCVISSKSTLGIGSTILNNIKISKNIFVGGGSLVTKNLLKQGIYKGIPAKIIS